MWVVVLTLVMVLSTWTIKDRGYLNSWTVTTSRLQHPKNVPAQTVSYPMIQSKPAALRAAEGLVIENIAKGTTDTGVDCFTQ